MVESEGRVYHRTDNLADSGQLYMENLAEEHTDYTPTSWLEMKQISS